MTTLSDHIRWLAQCRPSSSRCSTLTPGDLFHCGLGDYYTSRPYPNGLPVVKGAMSDCEWGRERLARARRDIAEHKEMFQIRQRAEQISDESFYLWCSIMRGELVHVD